MTFVLSLLTIFSTMLFTLMLPIGTECCYYTEFDIQILMNTDPHYQFHPCYIQWKFDEDAKIKQREELHKTITKEKSIAERNAIAEQNAIAERNAIAEKSSSDAIFQSQNLQREEMIRIKSEETKTKIMVITAVIIGGIIGICCIAALFAFLQKKLRNPATITVPDEDSALRSVHTAHPADRWPSTRESNVPLLLKAVVNRQTSLPSYDDVLRISSAPPKE